MNKKSIIIMLAYARSGGTLLNRCMASMPDTIMLSEVNVEALCPSSCNTIRGQVKEWYGINLKSEGFRENIQELYKYCLEKDKALIIRDWTFGSFVPSRYNNYNPSKEFATLDFVSNYFPVKSFAFVRDAIDIWLSLNASPRTFYDKDLIYLYEFVKKIFDRKIKIFKYEDFCKNPKKNMHSICDYVEIDYNEQFMNFFSYYKVTGDTDLPDSSRGLVENKINLLSRRAMSDVLFEEIKTKTKALEINKLLNY